MSAYIVLLRGINVGGKNKVPMATLKLKLEEMGFEDVRTYIQSGNVLLRSDLTATAVVTAIENMLPQMFKLDSSVIRILVLTHEQLRTVVKNKPKGFGEQPEKYHSDVVFLMGISTADALEVFKPREGVDTIWAGDEVVYSQRLSAERSKSRLSKIVGTPAYQRMTIRNWNTTVKLLDMC